MQKVFIIIICICTVVNVGLFICSRLEAKRSKVDTDEQRVDGIAGRAERNLDATEQCHRELADTVADCRRKGREASDLTKRARELNGRAKELCRKSRDILQETQDLLEDCCADNNSD